MNLFSNLEDIYGGSDADVFITDFRGFRCLYREIEEKLGDQGYLLGKYVYTVLKEIASFSVYSSMYEGLESGQQLRRLCRDAWEGKANNAPFYNRIKEYVSETVFPCREEQTCIFLCIIGLSGEWLEYAASDYRGLLAIHSKLDMSVIRRLYGRIADILGSEDELEMLNGYIYRRFLPNPPMAAFVQGFTNSLLKIFIALDPETRKYCYELAAEMLNERED